MKAEIPTKFTRGQLDLNKIIQKLGFQTIMEYEIGGYVIDIYLPNFNLGVEFDGIFHWRRRDEKRDRYLEEQFGIKTLRVTDLKNKELEEKIREFIIESTN